MQNFSPELNYPEWEKSSEELIVEGETTDEMIAESDPEMKELYNNWKR